MNSLNHKRSNFISFILALLVVVLFLSAVTFLLYEYYQRISTTLEEETTDYLDEVSQHMSLLVENRIRADFQTVRTVAMSVENNETALNSLASGVVDEELERFLVSENTSSSYDLVALVSTVGDNAGRAVFSDGTEGKVSSEVYYQRAKKGYGYISDAVWTERLGNDTIVFSYPITKAVGETREVVGVLIAYNDIDEFRNQVLVNSFNGEGYSIIVKANGAAVVRSAHEYSSTEYVNLFLYLDQNAKFDSTIVSAREFEAACASHEQGSFGYTMSGSGTDAEMNKYLTYTPLFNASDDAALRNTDWYFVTIIPRNLITNRATELVTLTANASILVGAICVVLVLVIVLIQTRSKSRLELLAYVDSVTKGANEYEFTATYSRLMKQEFSRRRIRKGRAKGYVLIVANLVRFKLVNEVFGREVGDGVLKYIHSVIADELTKGESVARLSADDFVMLLHFDSEDEIMRRLARVDSNINKGVAKRAIGIGEEYSIRMTMGLFIITDKTIPYSVAVERANIARENADEKYGGQCTYRFYDEYFRNQMIVEKQIENRMNLALERGEFQLFLQPKHELQKNSLAGAEALIRWRDSDGSMVSPGQFIPLFEQNGFITRVDIYIFEQVCIALRKWLDEGLTVVPISVNMSRRHFDRVNFLYPYMVLKQKYNIPDGLIEIELTESIIAENMDILTHAIDIIKDNGFNVSIDDFGSGYSSLTLLKSIRCDAVKLDKGFFADAHGHGDEERQQTVVTGIIRLIKQLKMKIVAEGIEEEEQLDSLRTMKCDMVQGYVFSRPIPLTEFEQKVQDHNAWLSKGGKKRGV